MRTSPDYINKGPNDPELWVIHNTDFSGVAYVGWTIKGSDQEFSYEWEVSNGKDLLSGNLVGTQFCRNRDDGKALEVPRWVIGRAVQVAVRHQLTRQMVNFVESL